MTPRRQHSHIPVQYGEYLHGWSKSAKIPARIKDGNLELLDGTPFPQLVDDGKVQIVVEATSFKDVKDRMLNTLKQTVVLFVPGDELWVTFNTKQCSLMPELENKPDLVTANFAKFGIGTKITLLEPLSMLIQGVYGGTLRDCETYIPILDKKVKSLNQAHTELSRKYKPHRTTHTGSTFRSIWYHEKDAWRPLEDKRYESLQVVKNQFPEYFEQNKHNIAAPPFRDIRYWEQ